MKRPDEKSPGLFKFVICCGNVTFSSNKTGFHSVNYEQHTHSYSRFCQTE